MPRIPLPRFRVNGVLNNSERRFQKDAVLVSGFTSFVWMEDQFCVLIKYVGSKLTKYRIKEVARR